MTVRFRQVSISLYPPCRSRTGESEGGPWRSGLPASALGCEARCEVRDVEKEAEVSSDAPSVWFTREIMPSVARYHMTTTVSCIECSILIKYINYNP
jgi:hypothetical protein